MAATIKIKRSAVAGKAPSTSDINGGELALNTKDGRLYSSDGTNKIIEIGANNHALKVGTGGVTFANGAYTFPTADGTSSQVMQTNGAGTLSFAGPFELSSTANTRLANTNTYIATKLDTSTFNAALANTNTYIATKASDVFKTVAIATSGSTQGTASVVADSATDTLTLIQGAGIQLTTNATSDSIKIESVQDVQDQLFANGTHFTAGTNTTIQLSRSYDTEASLWISFDGVLQFPDQYSISGNLVTFTSAIPTGTQQVYVKGGKVIPTTSGVTGTSTTTFTNKSIDADNNTISNLEVDNFKATAIVLEGQGIGSNDNDTTLPTSAAVKDYVDNNAGGVVTALNNATANELVTVGATTTELDAESNLTFDGSTLAVTGDITATGTVLVTGDTSSGDDAAIGYTAAEGLILTGQGSTSDVTIKNDADQEVLKVPTGTVNIETAGTIKTVGDIIADGDGSSGGITLSDGIVSIRTGTGSVAAIDLYCESGNAHKVTLQSPAHSAYSGNVALTLPTTSGTLTSTGKQSIYIPASAMYPTTTNGCAALAQVEGTAGRPELKCLDFDPSSAENAQFTVAFPKAWNSNTLTFQAFFTVSGTNTGTVSWKLSAVATADNDPIDATFGTAVAPTAKAHSGVSGDMDVTAESSAVTVAGSPGADEMVFFNIMRDVSADNQSGDARLLGIKLFFTTDKANDE